MSNNNNEVCEIVTSQKGRDKINVRGYLMVKEQVRNNTYYWCCEKRKSENCKSRAITKISDGSHYLQKCVDHNHSPQASNANVANIVARIKQQARETSEQPVQIIQRNTAIVPEEIASYMPTQNALCARIKRVRSAEMPPQPQTIDEIDIPESLQSTLDGDQFLIKDSIVGKKGSFYLLQEQTFLYTIHAPIGSEDANSRILPLVYVLMTGKAEVVYRRMFQDLNEFAEEHDIELRPSTIITNFEKASINASHHEFPSVNNKGCFFHLSQSGWRKIQESGLASQYGTDEHLSLMLRHLFALAFLPVDDIPNAFDLLKQEIPSDASDVVTWFEENYVHGKI
ncbi:hypothetical protein RclHR1_00560025 [Rhizophagus clarus]|uniref:FLYWCH-type domain-containing protein n=1 Tax=Rhizophagus clarus TaxID=94130 RepID=A0A2Z6RMW1_9GLOM|nr:hypothetical protein RclHR1_00560025 [Rhizophagus clarus]